MREGPKFCGSVEPLEGRIALSHVLPHHHAAHHPSHQVGGIHAEDVQAWSSKTGQTPPGWSAMVKVVKNPGPFLRAIAGGAPFLPGGPIAPPIVVNPAPANPAPVKPVPPKVAPAPVAPAPAPIKPPVVAN